MPPNIFASFSRCFRRFAIELFAASLAFATCRLSQLSLTPLIFAADAAITPTSPLAYAAAMPLFSPPHVIIS